jgi:HD-GYP domain-containing protein (c-di-GMP phosphodiesterase class II)
MRYKVKVSDLQAGMYVTELDRPWADTPFLFQGFLIESEEELSRLKSLCTFVVIDDAQSQVAVAEIGESEDGTAAASVKSDGAALKLGETGTQPVTAVHGAAQTQIGELFSKAEESTDLAGKIRESQILVQRLIRQSANPNLMMQLVNLRPAQDRHATHALHAAILAIAFGRHLGQPEERLSLLGLGAVLHDIGKLRVPAAILNKPEKLTDEEFAIVKRHPLDGFEMLKGLDGVAVEVLDMVRYHHERSDGSGYPQGIKGEELPLSASIIGLVDAYETLTGGRPYQAALSPAAALQQLRATVGAGFPAELIQDFTRFLGIYPVGSVVKLSSGDVAVVFASDPAKRLRPLILIVHDARGQPIQPRRLVNLTGLPMEKLTITDILDSKSCSVDIPKLFERELGRSV